MDILAAHETLPEIIRNDEALYEGNLIHYLQIVFKYAQNLSNPYHNLRHMMHVLYLCYQACVFYRSELTPRQMRNLLIAAIFHDFDHSGMFGNDNLNIARAIRAMEKYLLPEDRKATKDIAGLIRATEYPHKPGVLDRRAHILRDADLAQGISVAWIQQVVFGLAAEQNKTPLEVLAVQDAFIRGIKFQTNWARKMFPSWIIEKKASEMRELSELLRMDPS
jgi:hypothetical protein